MRITDKKLRRIIQEEFNRELLRSRKQSLQLEQAADELEGRPGNWRYKIVGNPPTGAGLTPDDVRDVRVKVSHGSNVGFEFALGDIAAREGEESYQSHPLVAQVIAVLSQVQAPTSGAGSATPLPTPKPKPKPAPTPKSKPAPMPKPKPVTTQTDVIIEPGKGSISEGGIKVTIPSNGNIKLNDDEYSVKNKIAGNIKTIQIEKKGDEISITGEGDSFAAKLRGPEVLPIDDDAKAQIASGAGEDEFVVQAGSYELNFKKIA